MRLILADPGLSGPAGHHLGYVEALAEVAARRGLAPLILAHQAFLPGPQQTNILPTFSARYQTSGAGGRGRAAILAACSRLPPWAAGAVATFLRRSRRGLHRGHADSFGRELAAALRRQRVTADDVLVLPSVSSANLAGLADALEPAALGRVAVVLRRLPAEMEQSDPGPIPTAAILRRLDRHFGPRLQVFADTRPLARLWREQAGISVTAVPLPVSVPEAVDRAAREPPHLVFPGGARNEKGYCLLPAITAFLLGRARFTIHSGPVGPGSDPEIQRAHRMLRAQAGPRLRLIEHALDPDAYLALLRDADLLLLPYDPLAYGQRSSGILAEARSLALPVIVPRGCWMEEEAGPARTLAFDFPQGFAASVRRALAELPRLKTAMREAAPGWRAEHNPTALLDVLLGVRPGL